MAKCQRTMRDMLFRAKGNREIVTSEVAVGSNSSTPSQPPTKLNDIQKANVDWKDAWFALFDWVEFNKELGRISCKICKEGGGKYVYANEGSTNIKVSAL